MMEVNSLVKTSKFSQNYKNKPVLSYGYAQMSGTKMPV